MFYTEQIRILTRTLLPERQTPVSMQLVVREKCFHNCSTSSYLSHYRKTYWRDESLAKTGNSGSTTAGSRVIRSSQKGWSRSRHTSGVFMILARRFIHLPWDLCWIPAPSIQPSTDAGAGLSQNCLREVMAENFKESWVSSKTSFMQIWQ